MLAFLVRFIAGATAWAVASVSLLMGVRFKEWAAWCVVAILLWLVVEAMTLAQQRVWDRERARKAADKGGEHVE